VEVEAHGESEVVIEIFQDKMDQKNDDPFYLEMDQKNDGAGDEDDDDSGSKTRAETGVDVIPNQRCTNTSVDDGQNAEPAASDLGGVHTASQIYRSMSESSGDEFVSICNGQSYYYFPPYSNY
jgi:hypothetical protein